MNTWNINLDVSKSTAYNVPVIIGQGDKAGATIRASIFDHGTQCDLTGMTAKFMLRSGAGYFEDASCTVSGSTITYAMDEEHAATVVGMAQAYFAIYQGTTHVYSTSRFDVKVLRAASSGADPAQSYSDDIVAATQAARAAADAANATASAVEDAVEGIEDAADAAQQAVANATQAVTSATTAVAATEGAAETANDAAARAEDAIDAMGDISELAVPLMSADVRGGAKLGEGLALTDGALGIDPAPHQSTGEVRGSIAALTAKGHAEQDGTPTPDSPVEIQVVRGRNLLPNGVTNGTTNGVTRTVNPDGSITLNGTATANTNITIAENLELEGAHYLSCCPQGGSKQTYYANMRSANGWGNGDTGNGLVTNGGVTAVAITIVNGYTCNNLTFYPQLVKGSTPQPYVPYGHVGMEVQGKNLIDPSVMLPGYITSDGKNTGSSTATYSRTDYIPVTGGETYYLSMTAQNASVYTAWYGENYDFIASANQRGQSSIRIDMPSNARYIRVTRITATKDTYQLIRSNEPQPFEPYYHHVIPIPLPSKGYAAALPDGTADTLTIDGAGKWEWECKTAEVDLGTLTWVKYGGNIYYAGISAFRVMKSGIVEVLCDAYLASSTVTLDGSNSKEPGTVFGRNDTVYVIVRTVDSFENAEEFKASVVGSTLLYALATITTESGYTDAPMPAIPSQATVTCPELDALGVTYLIGDDVRAMAEQWYARAQSEYEQRLTDLEEAVAQIIAS